jgi:hypothetical protein
MDRIYKYVVPPLDTFDLALPAGARVLSVQTQEGRPHVWAEVDTDAPDERRRFECFATGQPMPAASRVYVGTFQLDEGRLVYHLYESTGQ